MDMISQGSLSYCGRLFMPCFIIDIFAVPEDVYTIEVETTGMSTAGQSQTVECSAMETVEGLSNRVELAWFHSNGIPVVGGEEFLLENSIITGKTTLTLQFVTLRTSHAQTYTCEATLLSPALHGPLIKTTTVNVTVESKHAVPVCVYNKICPIRRFKVGICLVTSVSESSLKIAC